MGTAGRKSWTEELEIAKRYSALSDDYFKVLKKMLKSDNDKDYKWAVEQLSKAFVRMIPQNIGLDVQNPITVVFDSSFKKDDKTTRPTKKGSTK